VGMVGRAHHEGVDLCVHLLEHLAEIGVPFCLGEATKAPGGTSLIRVAQGHHALAAHGTDVSAALSAHPNTGDVEFLVGLVA